MAAIYHVLKAAHEIFASNNFVWTMAAITLRWKFFQACATGISMADRPSCTLWKYLIMPQDYQLDAEGTTTLMQVAWMSHQ